MSTILLFLHSSSLCVYLAICILLTWALIFREVIEKTRTKKVPKPDGTTEEKEVTEMVNLKMVRVKRPPQIRYFTYQKRGVKAKTTEQLQYDRIEGYWDGSYNDLTKENLTIRVWTGRVIGGNILAGEAT